eukprot:scaffold19169_cov147-Isochrysis_galbana.AAC.2
MTQRHSRRRQGRTESAASVARRLAYLGCPHPTCRAGGASRAGQCGASLKQRPPASGCACL